MAERRFVRHFLKVSDLKKEEIFQLWDRALELKSLQKLPKTLEGKVLALIFEKPSTRTRVSYEAGMLRLGGGTIFLSTKDLQLSRGEPIKDTARVLSGYVHGVVIRTYAQEWIEEFAQYAQVPVLNGLSDLYHPCQALSDFLTLYELKRLSPNEKIVWLGDGNNVANSWIELCAILDLPITVCTPQGYAPKAEWIDYLQKRYGAKVYLTSSPQEALKGATIVSTDVWASMGQEAEAEERKKVFAPYQLNEEKLKLAREEVLVLHCLPAHRGEEITEEVLEGRKSVVWLQSENKMWLHMALLEFLLRD